MTRERVCDFYRMYLLAVAIRGIYLYGICDIVILSTFIIVPKVH